MDKVLYKANQIYMEQIDSYCNSLNLNQQLFLLWIFKKTALIYLEKIDSSCISLIILTTTPRL